MPYRIGNLEVSSPFVLAPLAELTDAPFRRFLTRIGGTGLHYTAMITTSAARAFYHHSIRVDTSLPGSPPLIFQIAPSQPDEVTESIDLLTALNSPDGIDINMGCGAPSIRRMGAGSVLMRDPKRARSIVEKARSHWTGPLTVKIRSGESGDPDQLLDFSNMLLDAGADAIACHPRLITQRFTRTADWSLIRHLASSLSRPVIGNGDIKDAFSAVDRYKTSGAAAVMVGRACLSNPWLFCEASALNSGHSFTQPSPETKKSAILDLLRDIEFSFEVGRAKSRTDIAVSYLLSDLPFGRRAAIRAKQASSTTEAREIVSDFLGKNL